MPPALGAVKKSAKAPDVAAAVELICPAGDAKTEDAKKQAKLRKMLKDIARGGDINATDKNGQTALMYASALDERLAVCWLVAKGADVTLKSKKGKTAQDLAHTIALRELLDLSAQAPANATEALTLNDNTTLEQIALMVRRGGEVNSGEAESWVMKQEYTSPARLLLALGLKGSGEAFPLYSAIIRNDVKEVGKLLKANPKLKETPEDTPGLLSHAESGEMVRTLVAAGAVATKDDVFAALDKDTSVVQELIAAGAPIEHEIISGVSILDAVGNSAVIDVLVQAGVDPNTGKPLNSALKRRNSGIVQALLRNGAKADSDSISDLFQVTNSENPADPYNRYETDHYKDIPQILAELLKAGVKIDEKGWRSIASRLSNPHFHPVYTTPEDREADVKIIRTLLDAGLTPPRYILVCMQPQEKHTFRGASVQIKVEPHSNHGLAPAQRTAVTNLLLNAGADPLAVGNGLLSRNGTTTLMTVGTADAALAQRLIDAGVDPKARTADGILSALAEATSPEVVDLLLSKGADKADLVLTLQKARKENNAALIEHLEKLGVKE